MLRAVALLPRDLYRLTKDNDMSEYCENCRILQATIDELEAELAWSRREMGGQTVDEFIEHLQATIDELTIKHAHSVAERITLQKGHNEFNRAIDFAIDKLESDETKGFLSCWREGYWDACRKYGFTVDE